MKHIINDDAVDYDMSVFAMAAGLVADDLMIPNLSIVFWERGPLTSTLCELMDYFLLLNLT